MNQFECEIKNSENGTVTFSLGGRINESAEFPPLSDYSGKSIIIDLSNVTIINSLGIRKWILWMDQEHDARISLNAVPVMFINQMNLIKGFVPTGTTILSFFVPIYCESCDQESEQLFEIDKDYTWTKAKKALKDPLPLNPCDDGSPSELNTQADKYFNFFELLSE